MIAAVQRPVTESHTGLIGRLVRFRLRDIHLPDPSAVLEQLHGDDVLQGEVIDSTESATDSGLFLVIRVDGLLQPILLAAAGVIVSPTPSGQANT